MFWLPYMGRAAYAVALVFTILAVAATLDPAIAGRPLGPAI